MCHQPHPRQELPMSTDVISPLRQRMIEDMNARTLCAGTQRGHIRSCKRFAAFLKRSPETATLEDIRGFQLHLSETGVNICSRNRIMTGLRFLFRVTLLRRDLAAEIYHIREPQKVPLVMSPDETKRLLAVASSLKGRILLSLGYGCGLRAGEVVRLKVKHIDSVQKIIRIEQSKGRKDRNVMLSPEMLALLRQWWKARPSWHDAATPLEERWLFPGLRRANSGHVSLGQIKVMSAIERCRTAALGGHVARCENETCAHTIIAYNSCRNRHCPKCQGAAAREGRG